VSQVAKVPDVDHVVDKRITYAPALDAEQDPGDEGNNDREQASRGARSGQEAVQDGRHNRSGPRRPCPSVVPRPPEPRAHGRIADGGKPESRLAMRKRWSARGDSGGASGL